MEQAIHYFVVGYLGIINLIGFTIMGIDKQRAIKRKWRIPERTLLFIAVIGGGIGAFFGMYGFRHKTKHAKFVIILPLSAVIYLVLTLKYVFNII